MNRFLKRFIFFFIPLLAFTFCVVVIDPYNYFFGGNFIPDEDKISVINRSPESMPRGNTLWKSISFRQKPAGKIIIGDSRAFDLDTDTIKKVSGMEYFNFGVPGGNYRSIINTFWYINELVKPEQVYIQVGFYTYNANSKYDLMADAEKVMEKPYLFFTRWYFFQESLLDVYYAIKSKNEPIGQDDFDEKNWETVVQKQGRNALAKMQYPENYYLELKKISDYCIENDIQLYFIIFPDQQDFHSVIAEQSKEDLYARFKKDIYSLGKVYDFDVPSVNVREDRGNYRDIFHLNYSVINNLIIPTIWGIDRDALSLHTSN